MLRVGMVVGAGAGAGVGAGTGILTEAVRKHQAEVAESVPRRVLEKARLVLKYATLQKLSIHLGECCRKLR